MLFNGAGNCDDVDFKDPGERGQFVGNLSGLSFLLATNISFQCSMSVILQMPLQVPVLKRELANNMYSPTANILGKFTSNVILQFIYPLTLVLVLFWGLGISTTFENFCFFVLLSFLHCVTMSAQGYWCGVCSDYDSVAREMNISLLLVYMLTSGGLANVNSFPVYITWVQYINPVRYANQAYFYILTRQIPNEAPDFVRDEIIKSYGYDAITDAQCYWVLFGLMCMMLTLALVTTNFRNRRFL